MVEKARRARVEESRPDAEGEFDADAKSEWEILAREGSDDPPRYVGTVRAEDAEDAHEEATRLFCWYDSEVWVCPAEAIRRFSVDADDPETQPAVPESGTECRTHEL
jgi:rSAM-partnered protein